jgi:hypothetical protein
MLTHLDGRSTDRHDNSHDRVGRHGNVHHDEAPFGSNKSTNQRTTPALTGRGKWDGAAQAGVAEAGAEGLAYRFLCRPEVQECLEFFGLDAHPGELAGGEPALGEGGDVSGVAVFEVYADWARQTGGDRDQAVGVADAHAERVDMGTAGGVVPQYRGVVDEGAGELEEQGVGSRSLVALDGFQPDVHGGQIGARTLNHRKKVSR